MQEMLVGIPFAVILKELESKNVFGAPLKKPIGLTAENALM
jgi:hypothetical protein